MCPGRQHQRRNVHGGNFIRWRSSKQERPVLRIHHGLHRHPWSPPFSRSGHRLSGADRSHQRGAYERWRPGQDVPRTTQPVAPGDTTQRARHLQPGTSDAGYQCCGHAATWQCSVLLHRWECQFSKQYGDAKRPARHGVRRQSDHQSDRHFSKPVEHSWHQHSCRRGLWDVCKCEG